MAAINELNKVTEQLAQLLEQPITAKNRDDVLEAVNLQLDKRAQLLIEIHPPFSETEAELGAVLMEKDQAIQLKLNHLFLELKSELHVVKKQRATTTKYLDPYRNVASNDGSYWDKKK